MTGNRWERVWAIFEEAAKLPLEGRPGFLAEACGGDEKLRQRVEDLLVADREVDTYLDRPLVRQGSLPRAAGEEDGQAPAAASGTRIGPYRLVRRIGQGGMGDVHLAVRADESFERRVVIKLVRRDIESEAIHGRLRTERQILANLDHPHIARLYDGGATETGVPYFVLEYVEGVPIDEYCDRERLSIDQRLTLFRKVCSAVGYAHRNLVVHRDLKPSNILVAADGEPKLLDFGIAKLLDPAGTASGAQPTVAWHRVLTPNYASPEQIGGKPITTATDIYSLGVLLYVLLAGRLPHRLAGRSIPEIETILNTTEPLPPSVAVTRQPGQDGDGEIGARGAAAGARRQRLGRELAGDLDAIVLRALRSSPRLRYESVEQLAADVERYQTGLPVTARAGGWRYRAGKFVRRHRGAVAAAAAVAALLIGFAVAMALQAARVTYERNQAQRERDKKAQVLSLVLELFRLSSPYVVPGEELTVRQALERSLPLLESGLRDQPAVRAELLHASGSILVELGEAAVAREQLEEALEIRRRLHGDGHPEVAATLTALAAAAKELGALDEAEAMARRAVEIARGLKASRPADRVGPLNELVSVLCYRSEYEAAEAPAVEALALAGELAEEGAERITAVEQLARIRSAQGSYRESVRLNREALAMRRALRGEVHPDLIGPLNNLALGLRRLEELEAAQRAYEEAIALQRASFGEEHDNPALLNNLAAVLAARGEFARAEELYREARAALARIAGEKHPRVYALELQIARMGIRRGSAAEAEASVRRLQDLWGPRLGDHWWIDAGSGVLGESLSAQGRCDEAEPLLVRSFERLVGVATERVRQDALTRLREHLERCGRPGAVAAYEARLEAES